MTSTPRSARLWIETDAYGVIHDIAPDAASLLGLSQRGAYARDVRIFFPASFHPLSALMRVAEDETVEGTYRLHPRDRRPVPVRVRISSSTQQPSRAEHPRLLWWTLELHP